MESVVWGFAPQTLPKGAFLARLGSPFTDIALLLEGTVWAYVTDERSAEYNKTLHVAPCFVGQRPDDHRTTQPG